MTKRRVIDGWRQDLAVDFERHGRKCEWCHGPIDPAARRDAKTCSKKCRQAKSRFGVASAGAAVDESMSFGYGDPPYIGMARKYYGCAEVDHVELIEGLVRRFPHGWALSASAESLQAVLAMCPPGVRVACWVRGARPGKSVRPRSAWEPLIVYSGRIRQEGVEEYSSDVLLWGGRQPSHPGALIGMKSAAFAEWMFRQLGALQGDTMADLFPGSGAIGRAWDLFQNATPAPFDISDPRGARDVSRPGAKDVTRAERDGLSPERIRQIEAKALRRTSSRDRYRRDSCLAGAERHLNQIIERTTENEQTD